jgi:hypothetical protein
VYGVRQPFATDVGGMGCAMACYETTRAEGRPRAEPIRRLLPAVFKAGTWGALTVPDSTHQLGESWRG